MKDNAVILAADLPTPEQVLSVTKQVGGIVDGIKIGVATLLEAGTEILGAVRESIGDKPLLVDLKIADIGFRSNDGWDGTNAKIMRSLAGSGASHVTVHGFPGPGSVAEAAETAGEADIGVLLLPLMSHAGAGLFFSSRVESTRIAEETKQAGVNARLREGTGSPDVTECILLLGESLDVAGYIGPATRPEDLKRYRAVTKRPIWCPGFGRQDRLGRGMQEQFAEWHEIVGPASAAIVGSAIFKASDPAAAAAEIVEQRDRAVGN
jgi:orotidine-5'-phosphate decarboxylase